MMERGICTGRQIPIPPSTFPVNFAAKSLLA